MLLLLSQFLANTVASLEEYLAIEERTGVRHEYHNGKLRPMPGGSRRHSEIIGQVTFQLTKEFRSKNKSCKAMPSDMRVFVKSMQKSLYPDVTICCGERKYSIPNRKDFISNPLVVVEVLSPSTEAYDLGEKFKTYQELKSLREYVLIQQTHCYVEVRTLVDVENGLWKYTYYEKMDDVIQLKSIGAELPLSEVYYDIEFDEEEDAEELVEA